MTGPTVWLGTHRPYWLDQTDAPLFVSRRVFLKRRSSPGAGEMRDRLPRALGPWALDSGGYTELSLHGRWSVTLPRYVADVERLRDETGRLAWAAPMDWMCEPGVRERTGLDVAEHQRRTVRNFLELRQRLGALVVPVLQGWETDDFLRCAEMFATEGVELDAEPLVGVGSVCRRHQDAAIGRVLLAVRGLGIRVHAFGVRSSALERFGEALASADSMAWSAEARWDANHGIPSCDPARRRSCSNCLHRALAWHERQQHRAARSAADPQLRLEVA